MRSKKLSGLLNKAGSGASSDAIMLIAAKLMMAVLGLVVTRLLSQYFSVHDYGTYSQIMLLTTTLSSLTVLGMVDATNYFFSGQPNPILRQKYVATLFTLQAMVSAFTGGILLVMSGAIATYFDNADVKPLVIFGALLPFFQNLIAMLQVLFVSVGKARLLVVRNLAVSALRLVIAVGACMIAENVALVLLATVLLDVGQIAFFLVLLRREGCVIHPRHTDLRLTRRILSYCLPMAVFIIINSVNRDCDKYVVSAFTDTETLAVYTNAAKVLPVDIIMQAFITVLVPPLTRRIAAGKKDEAAKLYKYFIEITYVTTGILSCAAIAAAPSLMELLYTDKYLSGLPVFVVYLLVDILRFTNLTMVLAATGKTKMLMLLGACGLGGNLILNLVLFPFMGVLGPAVATLLVTLAMGIVILKQSAGALGTGLRGIFNCRFLAIFALENLAGVLLFSRLQMLLSRWGVHYMAVLLVVAGLYGMTMLALNGRRLLRDLKEVNLLTGKTQQEQ